MADLVHDTQHEFWRPPANQPATDTVLADACRRCGTEFMVGAAFCHVCGSNRHRAASAPGRNWTKYFEFVRAVDFAKAKNRLGLSLPSLCAFLIGVGLLIIALSMG